MRNIYSPNFQSRNLAPQYYIWISDKKIPNFSIKFHCLKRKEEGGSALKLPKCEIFDRSVFMIFTTLSLYGGGGGALWG